MSDTERAAPKVTGSPAEIWLVYGDLEHDDTHGQCCREGEVMWCEDAQFPADVRYIRADLAEQARAAIAQQPDIDTLVSQIMNLQAPYRSPNSDTADQAFRQGHKVARHAAAELVGAAIAQQPAPRVLMHDGALWSFLRTVIAEGVSIAVDVEEQRQGYEVRSARLDAEAARFADQFTERFGAAIAQPAEPCQHPRDSANVPPLIDADKQTDLISRLQDEADLCRNDGADDIADLLDEAVRALRDRTLMAPQADAQPVAPMLLKGIGKINGDGWKDTTRIGDVVYAWNREMPEPYAPGQFPRLGNPIWSASTQQYDFRAVPDDELPSVVDQAIEELRAEVGKLKDALAAPTARQPLTEERIVMDGLMMLPTEDAKDCAKSFEAGVRFAERAHGITQEGE